MIPTPLLGIAWRVLTFMVPVPVILIVAALAWVQFDKASSVRQAVNARVKELVAGADIAALEATLAAERQISARQADAAKEAERRMRVAVDAQVSLAVALAEIRTEKEALHGDLDDLLSRPVDLQCAVDPDLAKRLRVK